MTDERQLPGDQVGDLLDGVSGITENKKVGFWLQLGAFFARFGQSLAGKKRR